MSTPHTHTTEYGTIVKCYHETKSMLRTSSFWIGTFISFPIEHFVWDYIWPMSALTKWLGL